VKDEHVALAAGKPLAWFIKKVRVTQLREPKPMNLASYSPSRIRLLKNVIIWNLSSSRMKSESGVAAEAEEASWVQEGLSESISSDVMIFALILGWIRPLSSHSSSLSYPASE
jgi:hypothetical protein